MPQLPTDLIYNRADPSNFSAKINAYQVQLKGLEDRVNQENFPDIFNQTVINLCEILICCSVGKNQMLTDWFDTVNRTVYEHLSYLHELAQQHENKPGIEQIRHQLLRLLHPTIPFLPLVEANVSLKQAAVPKPIFERLVCSFGFRSRSTGVGGVALVPGRPLSFSELDEKNRAYEGSVNDFKVCVDLKESLYYRYFMNACELRFLLFIQLALYDNEKNWFEWKSEEDKNIAYFLTEAMMMKKIKEKLKIPSINQFTENFVRELLGYLNEQIKYDGDAKYLLEKRGEICDLLSEKISELMKGSRCRLLFLKPMVKRADNEESFKTTLAEVAEAIEVRLREEKYALDQFNRNKTKPTQDLSVLVKAAKIVQASLNKRSNASVMPQRVGLQSTSFTENRWSLRGESAPARLKSG